MSIHWASLVTVFAVSLGSAVTVVALVTLGLVGLAGLSASATPAASTAAAGQAEVDVSTRWVLPAPSCRATLALLSLTAAAAIVLLGLWAILDR